MMDEFEIRREDLEILDHNSRQDKAAGEEIPVNSDNGPDDGDELG